MRRSADIQIARARRTHRIRRRLRGTAGLPRLSVFRSHRHIAAQVIDDTIGKTIASASDRHESAGKRTRRSSSLLERAAAVGAELARQAIARGIRRVRFDRGRYRYHGVVAALAEGARKAGLQF